MTADPRTAILQGLELDACDREPIHVPGSIQPHGLLLIADPADRRVVAGAGDLEAVFGANWLGSRLDDLLEREAEAIADATAPGPGGALDLGTLAVADRQFAITVHRTGDAILVELEEVEGQSLAAGPVLDWLDRTASGFERAPDLQALCERAAAAFRTLTGFDRVMIYRFLDDDAGRVVAEDADPALGSFLNHHFPATDIPRQARALYVRNRARAIPTIDYVPQPIRPAEYGGTDLSDVALRSVSPIHLQYLANMGVGASASISIVKDGVLWGLIACHHGSAKRMPRDVRTIATALASGLARQIAAKEDTHTYRERLRLRTANDTVLPAVATSGDIRAAARLVGEELRQLLGGDGFAFVRGREIDCYGRCPAVEDMRDIARWVDARAIAEPFATDRLSEHLPDARHFTAEASGVLALPLLDDDAMLLWMRAEQVQEVEWAGNPHKQAAATPGQPLTPRTSFASWTEMVRGRSRRWTLEEVEAAHRLRRAIHDAQRTRRISELNDSLQRTIADKDALLTQKDLLMKEVDHRVQNSLQLVSAFLAMQARTAGPGPVAESLAEAQSRLSAVALVHRRLYRDDQIESVDLSRYLDELVADMRVSLGEQWGRQIALDLAPVLIPTDRAVSVGLVMTELVINATKYAYGGDAGPIAIALEQHRQRFRLIVADQGRGMAATRSDRKTGGFGSRMMDAVVTRIQGEIDHEDNHPGTRAILTAPIVDPR